MKGYIYNTDSFEVVAIITGDSNADVENAAEKMGYMGVDEYALTYTPAFGFQGGLIEIADPEIIFTSGR